MDKLIILLGFSIITNGKNIQYFSSFNLKGYGFGVESLMTDYVTLAADPKANLPDQFTGINFNDSLEHQFIKKLSDGSVI